MEHQLSDPQARVLGAMIEKLFTTPANYPMSPNAVRVACNQKNNRDPVVDYDDDQVYDALHALERMGYAGTEQADFGRVLKYRQTFAKAHDLEQGELAIMCELFNRGPQTPGELRSRCERLHPFKDLADVERCLAKLTARQFVVMLERAPGTKENRWGHLLSGQPRVVSRAEPATRHAVGETTSALTDRVAELDRKVAELEARLSALGG